MRQLLSDVLAFQVLSHLNVDHLPAEEENRHVLRVGFSAGSASIQLGKLILGTFLLYYSRLPFVLQLLEYFISVIALKLSLSMCKQTILAVACWGHSSSLLAMLF